MKRPMPRWKATATGAHTLEAHAHTGDRLAGLVDDDTRDERCGDEVHIDDDRAPRFGHLGRRAVLGIRGVARSLGLYTPVAPAARR